MKTHKMLVILAIAGLLASISGIALAAALKWSQPPVLWEEDPYPGCYQGWDEISDYLDGPIIADDWLSEDDLPVTDIHWWGSYKGWISDTQELPNVLPDSFHIGIWTDVPSPPEPFSHPGELLWEYTVTHEAAFKERDGCDYYPNLADSPEACYTYEVILPELDWFTPEAGTIYWVSISAIYSQVPENPWGWTTRPHFYNDDAVRVLDINPSFPPQIGDTYNGGEPIEEPEGVSWDMAFQLTTLDDGPDWGDAPEAADPYNYPTTQANNGPHHTGDPVRLGLEWDGESDGQPSLAADGDDVNGIVDDEDGVTFDTPLVLGKVATVTVSTQGSQEDCYLNAWIDFDINGKWEHPAEQIFTDLLLPPGASYSLPYNVPAAAQIGTSYARFRCSTTQGLPPWHDPYHPDPDGEVEDYRVEIEQEITPGWTKMIRVNDGHWIPWQDGLALTTQTSDTLTVVDTVYYDPPMSAQLLEDWDSDHLSLTSVISTAGFILPGPDSDSLVWDIPPLSVPATLTKTFHVEPCTWQETILRETLTPEVGFPEQRDVLILKLPPVLNIDSLYDREVYRGQPATFTLVYSNTGGNESAASIINRFPPEAPFVESDPGPDYADPTMAEWQLGDLAMGELGLITVTVRINENAEVSSTIDIPDTIYNHLGEPIDTVTTTYHVNEYADWGDAPDDVLVPRYPTLMINNGASHLITPLFLGASIDPEPDGQPNTYATGDDSDGTDDEDGVFFRTVPLIADQPVTIDVIASAPGRLNAWVDFDMDGVWGSTALEQIFTDEPLAAGANTLVFYIPPGVNGDTFARFRVNTAGGLHPGGPADDGEVEDYMLSIEEQGETLFDWGDAPRIYPTLASSNGAHHNWVDGIHLGNYVDFETDGQPNADATGDDIAGGDDEDGVTFNSLIVAGRNARVTVVASQTGLLNAWIDFNQDATWDAAEQIFTDVILAPGANALVFTVPDGADAGETFARFRFSTIGGLTSKGQAPNGEVEDYLVTVRKRYISVIPGLWSNPLTWGGGSVPGPYDLVTIGAGTQVSVTSNTSCYSVSIPSGARLNIETDIVLNTENLENQGELRMLKTNASPSAFYVENNAGDPVYRGFVITPTSSMGVITATIFGEQECTTGDTVNRCFEIEPTATQPATITFYYNDTEREGRTYTAVRAWHWDGTWASLNTIGTGSDALGYWVTANNVTNYSPFVLKESDPTHLRLTDLGTRTSLLALLIASTALTATLYLRKRRKD